jgi:LPXTG-motif cell wall-anchored protein
MIEILIAAALMAGPTATPGPDSPACEPGQVSWVDGCAQPQLPGEVIGRQIDGPNGEPLVVVGLDANGGQILAPAPTPAPLTVLAHTGVPTAPYAAVAGALIAAGAGLLVVRRRSAR